MEEGKPAAVAERIVEGRIGKFYEQVCLLEQRYVFDEDKTVKEILTDAVAKIGENITVRRIARVTSDGVLVQLQCGDGNRDRTLVSVAKIKSGVWPAYLARRRLCHRQNLDRVAGERLQVYLREMLRDLRHPPSTCTVRVTEELLAACCWHMMERGVLAPSRAHRALQDLHEHIGADMDCRQISSIVASASVRESSSRSLFAWPEVGAAAHDVVRQQVQSLVLRAVRHDVG
jgi:hypothetical protein